MGRDRTSTASGSSEDRCHGQDGGARQDLDCISLITTLPPGPGCRGASGRGRHRASSTSAFADRRMWNHRNTPAQGRCRGQTSRRVRTWTASRIEHIRVHRPQDVEPWEHPPQGRCQSQDVAARQDVDGIALRAHPRSPRAGGEPEEHPAPRVATRARTTRRNTTSMASRSSHLRGHGRQDVERQEHRLRRARCHGQGEAARPDLDGDVLVTAETTSKVQEQSGERGEVMSDDVDSIRLSTASRPPTGRRAAGRRATERRGNRTPPGRQDVALRCKQTCRANIALQLIGTPACTLVPRLATRRANT